ncbi:MAG: sensor histidine kinase [Chloroflexi bacterium]|nr:sensor histidine kinase [Chloroflexota bacterium]
MANTNQQQTDVWVKWDWLWKTIFYVAVFISVVLMLLDDGRRAPIWMLLALAAFLTIWHWAGIKLTYKQEADWEDKAPVRFFVFLVDIILWLILVNLSPAYYFVLFGMFGQIFRYLPIRFAIVETLILTAAILYAQYGQEGQTLSLRDPLFWLYLLLGAVGITLGIWVSAIINQSTRRRELIEQLETTQTELATTKRHEGMLEERQRLARDIHDTLAQGFTSIVMHLEAAEQALPDDLDTLQKHLNRARSAARTSLDQARRVVHDLRPDLLETRSLPEAIQRTAARWTEETGVPINLTTTGDPLLLHPDIEVTLLRATQEALSNIRKHAQAQDVSLTLSYMGDVVVLDVQDNGVGLNGAAPSPFTGGYGLQAMRERAEHCGGSVELESEPGEGTILVVSIPISNEARYAD